MLCPNSVDASVLSAIAYASEATAPQVGASVPYLPAAYSRVHSNEWQLLHKFLQKTNHGTQTRQAEGSTTGCNGEGGDHA